MAGLRAMARLFDRRRTAILSLLAGWVLIEGLGAGAAPDSTRWLGVPSLERVLLVVTSIAAVVGVALFVLMLTFVRRGQGELPARKPMWPAIALLLLVVALATVVPRSEESPPEPDEPVVVDRDGDEAARREAVVGRDELGTVLLVLATAIGVIVWSRRRAGTSIQPAAEPRSLDVGLERAVERSSQTLLSADDPRSAVLLAYAELEEALAGLGHPRQSAETPAEHMARVLVGVSIDAQPLIDLAGLYEVARFSAHPVTGEDRRRAALALEASRRRLAAVR